MSRSPDRHRLSRGSAWLLTLSCAALAVPAVADPPPWAPAHGYYKHKDRDRWEGQEHHQDRYEYERQHDYDYGHAYAPRYGAEAAAGPSYLVDGRCNREGIGQVIGGVVGGVAGSRIGKGDSKVVATIAGTLIGAVIGGSMGRAMDDADVACVGQALEYGHQGQPVSWTNPNNGVDYSLTPTRSYQSNGSYCRDFTRVAMIDGERQSLHGTACRQPDGSWQEQP